MKHSFRKLLIFLCVLTMCASTALAQWSKVWEQPAVDYHVLGNQFTITRVEMNERQTLVSFHCWIGTVEPVDFIKVFVLRSAGKEYTAQSATGITLEQDIIMPESCNLDFTVAFEPFAEEVTSFDCEIQGVLTIENVRDRHAPQADLADTYWRNATTGDWLIGFDDDAVIYDTRIWDIVGRTERKGAFDYTVRNGNEELCIRVSKEKKGRRDIRIGEAKATTCERITSRLMPPYPVPDTRPSLADNGYRMGDSVTIVGWYRNMNERARKCGDEERQLILEASSAKPISRRMMELVKKHEGLYEATDAFLPLYKYRKFLSIVDSLDWTQLQRDIYLSRSLCKLIDTKRSALVPRLLDLANNSPDESWRNVIKEYNVQGNNVVHYNLPADQQEAVESFLKVSAFPTYRLIDAEGHILDVNTAPRDLDALERVIKQVTGK